VLDRFLEWLFHLPRVPTYAVLALLSALENVFPPVPADVAVALGAFLAAQGEVSAVLLGVICWAANQASAAGMYFFARRHGAAFFGEGWGRKLMPPEAMAVIQEAYDRFGVLGIFFSRFLPGIRAAVTPFAGVVGMPAARALVPAGLASALWYAFLVGTGVTLGQNLEAVKRLVDDANRWLGLVALVVTSGFAFWLLRRLRRKRST
jgi:membrane protein DedA with SNARE-associated domain